ncbi:uncharacterized protein PG998_005424 [Apiospora kogelbergensis]|uniref:uncharacterized protein n=1 Tax=Apiospora kogelbergensis TaxID=1337665 RepID=UPI00312DACD6
MRSWPAKSAKSARSGWHREMQLFSHTAMFAFEIGEAKPGGDSSLPMIVSQDAQTSAGQARGAMGQNVG